MERLVFQFLLFTVVFCDMGLALAQPLDNKSHFILRENQKLSSSLLALKKPLNVPKWSRELNHQNRSLTRFPQSKPSKEQQISQYILDQIKQKGLKSESLGLIISYKEKDIYSFNADKLFIPASLAKIPVLSALYHFYPVSYTFTTSFLSSDPLKKGVLKGDLILKGGGDSSFTSESLWKLVNILTRSGLKKVEGDLIIDDSLYNKEDSLLYSERSYSAPSSASSFNWNSVAFYIRPGKAISSPAVVYANPQNQYIEVINKVKTGRKNKVTVKRIKTYSNKEVFELRGEIKLTEKEIIKYRNITQPVFWLGFNALDFLKQRGILVSGSVKKGSCKSKCLILAEWESRPFPFHSYNMMKYSSNFVTRMLVSHIPLLNEVNKVSNIKSGELSLKWESLKKGDLNKGMEQVQSYLRNKEGFKNFKLKEPSGLSRNNRLSPRDIKNSLVSFHKIQYKPEMMASYPLAQSTGTLSKRFQNLSPDSFVRAKTGSLYGVLGLAGWAGTKKRQYHFVFLYNGKKSQQAKQLFDQSLLFLIE